MEARCRAEATLVLAEESADADTREREECAAPAAVAPAEGAVPDRRTPERNEEGTAPGAWVAGDPADPRNDAKRDEAGWMRGD